MKSYPDLDVVLFEQAVLNFFVEHELKSMVFYSIHKYMPKMYQNS